MALVTQACNIRSVNRFTIKVPPMHRCSPNPSRVTRGVAVLFHLLSTAFCAYFSRPFRRLASSAPELYGGPYSALMAPEYREDGRYAGQHHWNTSREVGNPDRKTTTPSASGATGTDLAKFSDFAPVLGYCAVYRQPIGSVCDHAVAKHAMIRWRSRTASAILLLPLTSRGC